MARAGVSKFHVKQARATLLARGEHPSIDAVRVALGNTGSKSTIHRYLQELAEEEGSSRNDEQWLSDTLRASIAGLARQLREEAEAQVTAAETRHAAEVGAQRAEIVRLVQALGEVQVQAKQLSEELARELEAHAATREVLQQERISSAATANENAALSLRLQEHVRHIESLEEKHRHARDSLEHYRQSVKDQRDLDQRRHDTRVQLLQAELRQLGLTLGTKQDEVTRSGQDCARLSAELADARRELREAQQHVREVQRVRDDLVAIQARLEANQTTLTAQLEVAEAARQTLVAEEHALRQALAEQDGCVQRLQVRLDVQATLYSDLQRRLDGLGVSPAPANVAG